MSQGRRLEQSGNLVSTFLRSMKLEDGVSTDFTGGGTRADDTGQALMHGFQDRDAKAFVSAAGEQNIGCIQSLRQFFIADAAHELDHL